MSVRWLHLSDFHIGKDQYPQRSLLDDILNHVEEYISAENYPHYIFFTGDLTNSGLKKEYAEFNVFVKNLKGIFADQNIELPELFFVPGNHDLRWRSDPWETFQIPEIHYILIVH